MWWRRAGPMCTVQCGPVVRSTVLAKENSPYNCKVNCKYSLKWTDIISAYYLHIHNITICDWDQPKIDLASEKTLYPWTLYTGRNVYLNQVNFQRNRDAGGWNGIEPFNNLNVLECNRPRERQSERARWQTRTISDDQGWKRRRWSPWVCWHFLRSPYQDQGEWKKKSTKFHHT